LAVLAILGNGINGCKAFTWAKKLETISAVILVLDVHTEKLQSGPLYVVCHQYSKDQH